MGEHTGHQAQEILLLFFIHHTLVFINPSAYTSCFIKKKDVGDNYGNHGCKNIEGEVSSKGYYDYLRQSPQGTSHVDIL